MVMVCREVLKLEIGEVVRRCQAGNSQRNIASVTGLSRDTVRKYLAAAKETVVDQEGPAPTRTSAAGWLASAAPALGSLRRPLRSCWQPEGVRWPTRPCTGSSLVATGGAGAAARSG